MFGIGMPELIVILLILLVIFGASRLPEIGSGLGKGIRNFKKSISDTEKGLNTGANNEKSADKDTNNVG